MKCPFCACQEDRVLESRVVQEGDAIRRRRECTTCERRFTTYEQVEEMRVMVVKKDGRRESFDRGKILTGMIIACRKRPVAMETLQSVVEDIERRVFDLGPGELASERIGAMVADELRALDQVAYVRFASVYRQFEDVGQFSEIIQEVGMSQE